MKWTVVESHQSLEPFASTSQVSYIVCVLLQPYNHVIECRDINSKIAYAHCVSHVLQCL